MIYRLGRALFKYIVNIILYRFTIKGKENVPKSGGLIICPNHVSLYDPIVIATQLDRPVHYMAKAELYKHALVAWVMRAVKTIPVNRGNVSVQTLKESMKVLKDGGILGIFPEGTRVAEGEEKPPMDGFVVFALKTKSPILPVHIQGRFKFRSHITITFGAPITLEEYYGKKLKAPEMSEISQKIMDQVYALD